MKKKLFFLLTLLVCCIGQAWGETAELKSVSAKNVVTTKGESVSLAFGDVTCKVTRNSSNQPGFYTSSGIVRYYGDDVMTLSVPEGSTITSIAFAYTSGGTNHSTDVGTFSSDGKGWTGSANSVSFTGSGTVKINTISVTYTVGSPSDVLQSLTVSGTPTKTTYEAGEEFDPAGLTVTGTYSESGNKTITNGITWSVTPETLTAGTTSVSVVATVGDVESSAYTVNGLTVTEKEGPGEETTDAITNWNALFGTSYDGSISGVTKNTDILTGTTESGVVIKINSGASTNGYVKNTDFRMYNGYKMTLTAPTGYVITKVTATKSGKTIAGITADPEGLEIASGGASMEWSGSTASLVFSATTTMGFGEMSITIKASTPSTTPSISAKNVDIAADATSGEIAYEITNPVTGKTLTATTDASWISNIQVAADKVTFTTTANTEASERTANITLKYEGATDKVVTVTQKGATVALTTIDQIFAKATEAGSTATEISVKFDGWYVTGVKGSNAYVTDGTKGFIIYGNGHGFVVGDALTGTVTCKVQLFNGSAELTELTTSTEGLTVTPNHAITTVEKTIDQLSGINTGAVVTIKNITYDGEDFTDGTNTIVPFNSLMALPTFEENGKYNITGVYLQYGGKKEILPRSEADIETLTTTKYTIIWSVNGTTTTEDVEEGDPINFKPATVPAGYTDYVFRGWVTSETVSGTTEPTYVTTATATGNVTYYAVFAKKTTTGGTASIEKLDGTSTLADGDKLAIFAHVGDNYYGMKHETISTSYVNYYVLNKEPSYEAVIADDLNWCTLNNEESNWTLGDTEKGYLANSDNNLYADKPAGKFFSIAWDSENSAYTIKNGTRWVGCRSDLTGDNQYKFRGAGTGTTPTKNSSCYLDIYRISTGTTTTTYSDFTTSLVAPEAYTLEVSQHGYSTLYLDKAVEIPEDVTVYYCTYKNAESLSAVKIDSDYIPANTGVVVEAKAGTYAFNYTDQQVDEFSGSELRGVLVDTPVQERRASHNNAPVYVLSIVDGKVGFYKYADTETLKANRAFFEGAEDAPPVNGFILDFDMETVGVSSVVNATNLKAGHDLTGRKVVKSSPHGIFLQKGRKLIR